MSAPFYTILHQVVNTPVDNDEFPVDNAEILVSSDPASAPPRSPRRQVETPANASISSEYALSGARDGLEPHQPSSPERDAFSYQDLDSDVTEPSLARILELHRDAPWVGDQLDGYDTSRILRAYTSMAVALAVCERLDGDRLSALLALALSRQDDRHPQAGIDDAAAAVLEALGKW